MRSVDLSSFGSCERNLPAAKAPWGPSERRERVTYWLQMGYPEMALKELQTLPESARRHPWTRRVSFDATVAQLHQAAA